MKHRCKIRRYLLTASWEAICYDCVFNYISPWWYGLVVISVEHTENEEQERIAMLIWERP